MPAGSDGNLKLGSNDIDALNFGTGEVQAVYLGSNQIWRLSTVLTITVDNSSVLIQEIVTATFTFDVPVTGFTAADVTISGGTKGALNGSGDTYTMEITAPSSGSDTVTISVAAGAVSPNNNADSVDFMYRSPRAYIRGKDTTADVIFIASDNPNSQNVHFSSSSSPGSPTVTINHNSSTSTNLALRVGTSSQGEDIRAALHGQTVAGVTYVVGVLILGEDLRNSGIYPFT